MDIMLATVEGMKDNVKEDNLSELMIERKVIPKDRLERGSRLR